MRKILLFPLRLCVGWGISPRLLGLIGATMLVLLRLTIGWHFYSEGLEKYQKGNCGTGTDAFKDQCGADPDRDSETIDVGSSGDVEKCV